MIQKELSRPSNTVSTREGDKAQRLPAHHQMPENHGEPSAYRRTRLGDCLVWREIKIHQPFRVVDEPKFHKNIFAGWQQCDPVLAAADWQQRMVR